MITAPIISICIPAYNRTNYLRRLLDSIAVQTYKNYEVIVTDDSPNDEVNYLCSTYQHLLPIQYFKNPVALGTPENWNEAIRKANGEWMKIMHDDDWFTHEDSLLQFFNAVQEAEDTSFIFAAYNNIYEKNDRKKMFRVSLLNKMFLQRDELYLLRANYVGNPSCTMFRKTIVEFDKRFKYVVDFEFYMNFFRTNGRKFLYIGTPLINVGINDSQVTTYTFRVHAVEIPENHKMLKKLGFKSLRNIFVYDYFWRLYRNLQITTVQQLNSYGYSGQLSPVLVSMLDWQKKIPVRLLSFGIFSKAIMLLHYSIHFSKIK